MSEEKNNNMQSKTTAQVGVLLLSLALLGSALAGCVQPERGPTATVVVGSGETTSTVTVTSAPATSTPSLTATASSVAPKPTMTLPEQTPSAVPATATPLSPSPTVTPTPKPWVTLVRGPGDPVYLVIEGVERRWFPNSQSFEAFTQEYGLGWDDIKSYKDYPELWRQTCRLPCGDPMPHYYPVKKGSLVRSADSPDVYEITNEIREGVKRQVKSLATEQVDENQVACVAQEWLDALPEATQ